MLRHRMATSVATIAALVVAGAVPALAEGEASDAEEVNVTCEAESSQDCAGEDGEDRDKDRDEGKKDRDRDKDRDEGKKDRDRDNDRDEGKKDRDRDNDRDEGKKDRDRDKKDRDKKKAAPVPKAVPAGLSGSESGGGPAGGFGLIAAVVALATAVAVVIRRRLVHGS